VGWSGISDGVAGEGNCRWHLVQNFDPGWFQFAPQYGQGGDANASTATDYPISSARTNPLAGGLTLAERYKAVAGSITEMIEALVAAAGLPNGKTSSRRCRRAGSRLGCVLGLPTRDSDANRATGRDDRAAGGRLSRARSSCYPGGSLPGGPSPHVDRTTTTGEPEDQRLHYQGATSVLDLPDAINLGRARSQARQKLRPLLRRHHRPTSLTRRKLAEDELKVVELARDPASFRNDIAQGHDCNLTVFADRDQAGLMIRQQIGGGHTKAGRPDAVNRRG
jgi:hypothetical protein